MPNTLRPKDPPVSYNFKVTLAPSTTSSSSALVAAAVASLDSDAAFTQISGLGVQLNVNQVRSGGYNNQVYHLPGGVNQGSLTLAPKTIVVTLMDKNPNNAPVMTWILYNAIPVKWEIDELDAKKSDIVIESIEIVFSSMIVV
jgi:hypothetical protein